MLNDPMDIELRVTWIYIDLWVGNSWLVSNIIPESNMRVDTIKIHHSDFITTESSIDNFVSNIY